MRSISPSIADQLKALGLKSSTDPVNGYKYYTVRFEATKVSEDDELLKAALDRVKVVAEWLLAWTKDEYLPVGDVSSAYLVNIRSLSQRDNGETIFREELATIQKLPSTPPEIVQAISELGIVVSAYEAQPQRATYDGKTLIDLFDEQD